MTFRNTHRLAVIGFVVALLVVQIFSANAASITVLNEEGNWITFPVKFEEARHQEYIKYLYNNYDCVVKEKKDEVVIKFKERVHLKTMSVKRINLTKDEFETLKLEEK